MQIGRPPGRGLLACDQSPLHDGNDVERTSPTRRSVPAMARAQKRPPESGSDLSDIYQGHRPATKCVQRALDRLHRSHRILYVLRDHNSRYMHVLHWCCSSCLMKKLVSQSVVLYCTYSVAKNTPQLYIYLARMSDPFTCSCSHYH